MNRTEYLNTIDGQKYRYYERFIHNIFLEYMGEPYSKKSIKNTVSGNFRQEIRNQLLKQKRKCHQSGINLEIVFQTTQNNPPSIQSLVKNYLDLLHENEKVPPVDNLKSILFKNDNQIKYLNARVNHNILGKDEPLIRIRSYKHSYFIQDLEFAYRILNKKFENNDRLCYYDFEGEIEEEQERQLPKIHSLWDSFYEFKRDKESHINLIGEEAYNSMSLGNLREIQQAYLNLNNLSVRDLVTIFHPLILKSKLLNFHPEINEIFEATSKMIMLSFKLIPLIKYPKNEGDSKRIKSNLENKLAEFKHKHKILFPLVQPIKLIILYSLPIKVNREIDSDNLARKHIIPLVQNIFNPPTVAKGIRKIEEQTIPQYSILGYEVLQIPRDSNTPKEGRVSLIITDGLNYNSLWGKVNDLIKRFIDKN